MRRGPWCRRTPSGTATWWSRSRSSRRCASTARPGGASSTRRGASAAPRSPPTAQASAESTFGVDAEACKRARVEVPGDHDVLGLLERSQRAARGFTQDARSEEHTSELQSQSNLVCRLLLEKKNEKKVT